MVTSFFQCTKIRKTTSLQSHLETLFSIFSQFCAIILVFMSTQFYFILWLSRITSKQAAQNITSNVTVMKMYINRYFAHCTIVITPKKDVADTSESFEHIQFKIYSTIQGGKFIFIAKAYESYHTSFP